MKKLLILFLLSSKIISAQAPPGMVMRMLPGDIAYSEADYKNAIILFNRTINEGKGDGVVEHNLAVVYAIAGNRDSAFYFLDRTVRIYKDDMLRIILGDPDMFLLIKDKRWKKYERLATKEYFQKHEVVNKELCSRLLRMLMYDQAYYYMLESIKRERGEDDPEIKKLWNIKDSLNKKNLMELEIIIKKYGYPTKKLVSEKAASAAFLIIQHADIKTQEKYLPMLEKLAFDDEIDKANYASLKDRVLISEGKKQVYGTQVKIEKNGTNSFFPIEDSTNVNKRRKEMGLEPLDNYFKRVNNMLPPFK